MQIANLISAPGPLVFNGHIRLRSVKASPSYLTSDHLALPGVKAVVDHPYHLMKSLNTADPHLMGSRGLGQRVTENRLFPHCIRPIGKLTYRI